MSTRIHGLQSRDPLRRLVEQKLDSVLRRSHVRPTSCVVHFTDVNGPKGGLDIRCGVTVETPRRPAWHASALAASSRLALEVALLALEHELRRDRGRRRDLARRPKKYFVADVGIRSEGEAALPPVRRRRRSA
jgi:hypothetical protein